VRSVAADRRPRGRPERNHRLGGRPTRSQRQLHRTGGAGRERFSIRITTCSGTTSYNVRCLPGDFPSWEAERTGTPQAQFYATSLIQGFSPGYQAVFDTNGVPVWWGRTKKASFLFEPLPNKHFMTALTDGPGPELSLTGQVVRTVNTVGAPGDFHDIRLLPDGNYVRATATQQQGDLSSWGQSSNATVVDPVIQVITQKERYTKKNK